MKAKTDGGPEQTNAEKPDYIENLFLLMNLVSDKDTVANFETDFNTCNIRYGDMKKQLAEDMVKFVSPIRQKADSIRNDEQYLKNYGTGCGKSPQKCRGYYGFSKRGNGIKLLRDLS